MFCHLNSPRSWPHLNIKHYMHTSKVPCFWNQFRHRNIGSLQFRRESFFFVIPCDFSKWYSLTFPIILSLKLFNIKTHVDCTFAYIIIFCYVIFLFCHVFHLFDHIQRLICTAVAIHYSYKFVFVLLNMENVCRSWT